MLSPCYAVDLEASKALIDKSAPIVVDADEQELDIKNNTLTFTGNVEISQGLLSIKADKLNIIKGDTDNSKVLIAYGQPTVFSQKLDDGSYLSAQAKQIKYKVTEKELTLKGDAKINQADSQISGDEIKYNVAQKKLVASSSEDSKQRVHTVLNLGE
ncbi:lipopolysaccharide transport periplasmic protein LptA [Catenovulum sp. SM1970]|uniref:lipopolysaccharide transport periplasmic protein LptA n=1 Tax=Marinifaba aquimaris TaxID=2741323 RepID=UPI001572EA20|nr:lipopolysaccharide transport periplasmic protein LptA [Marinifaba aquimaris]NTS75892.1 lipopolysaccharide transport periplasmic protein LptA [Marinifaba aquimaris]